MKLSDAIKAGDKMKTATSVYFLAGTETKPMGCALGGAYLANGGTIASWQEATLIWRMENPGNASHGILRTIWPWLTDDMIWEIASKYSEKGVNSVISYVRSIEQ